MSTAAWAQALDRLAAAAAAHERLLATGTLDDPAVAVPELPADLGPLPVELADRAVEVRDALDAVAGRLAEARDRTGRQLALTRKLGHGGERRPTAAYVDRAV